MAVYCFQPHINIQPTRVTDHSATLVDYIYMMMSLIATSLNFCQTMCLRTKNSRTKAFGDRSSSKNFKPKKIEVGGGGASN